MYYHSVFRYLLSTVVDELGVKLFLDDDVTLFQFLPLFFILPTLSLISHPLSFCLLFYLLPLHLSHALFHLSSFLLSFSVTALCLKPTYLSQCLHSQNRNPLFLPLSSFMFLLSVHPSIHHPTLSPSLSLPLISLPMLWFVSPVSVRTVITAVSSLGENKVVLCSRHHKRHERNKRKEPQLKKKGKIKKEGSKPEERRGA